MTAPGRTQVLGSESVVLNGAGNGTVSIRPDGPHEYWLPDKASVIAPNPAGGVPTNEAQCLIYIGPKVDSRYFVDGTYTGSSGNVTDAVAGYVIGQRAEPRIWAVWTGGDPGATATLRVSGTKEIR